MLTYREISREISLINNFSSVDWDQVSLIKHVAGDDLNSISFNERRTLTQADEIFKVAKLSDKNLLKPGQMVITLHFNILQ